MDTQHVFETLVARYPRLADAEAALHELQSAAIPYPDIRMVAQAAQDCPYAVASDRAATCWSLTVMLDGPASERIDPILRHHGPRVVSRQPAPQHGRSETDQGAIAWRHYVFATPSATDWVGDSAGTNGTTGVISSGVFADGALVEGNPPTRDLPRSRHRPDQRPDS
jgi:hypothetical protein